MFLSPGMSAFFQAWQNVYRNCLEDESHLPHHTHTEIIISPAPWGLGMVELDTKACFSADILEHNPKAAGTGAPNGRQPALQP